MKEECILLRELSSIPNIDITIPTNWLLINSMSDNNNITYFILLFHTGSFPSQDIITNNKQKNNTINKTLHKYINYCIIKKVI